MPADGVVVTKPANLSYEEAAPVCDGALTSMSFLKDIAHIQPGQHVLINGASGSLGTAAVQLAKHFGAVVTGVCSTANVALVKSLGSDKVIDYTKEDFTNAGQSYDIIYDTVGKSSFSKCKSTLKKNGLYISPVLGLSLLFQMLFTAKSSGKKAMFSATGLRSAAELKPLLKELSTSFEAGAIRSVIDRRCSLDEAVEAHTYVDTGRKKGNVALTLTEYSKN
ncbi:MAG: NAD(P)-dependent alcohol dehydrogenase [Rhodothermales bacterium]